jgi:hypothetical protein
LLTVAGSCVGPCKAPLISWYKFNDNTDAVSDCPLLWSSACSSFRSCVLHCRRFDSASPRPRSFCCPLLCPEYRYPCCRLADAPLVSHSLFRCAVVPDLQGLDTCGRAPLVTTGSGAAIGIAIAAPGTGRDGAQIISFGPGHDALTSAEVRNECG